MTEIKSEETFLPTDGDLLRITKKGVTMEKWKHSIIGLAFALLLVFSVSVLLPGSGMAQGEINNDKLSTDTASSIEELLEGRIPFWDSYINSVPFDVKQDTFLSNPQDIVELVSQKQFDYQGLIENGSVVYADKESMYKSMYKYHPEKGFWKFVSEPKSNIDGVEGTFTKNQAEAHAEQIFHSLGLPESERGSVKNVNVGGAGRKTSIRADARHVRIHRKINGIRVMDSHLMMTYEMDGTPFRMEVRWPIFALDESKQLISRTHAIGDLKEEILTRYGKAESISNILTRMYYWYNEDSRLFEPTVIVGIVYDDGYVSPSVIKYSLVRGILDGSYRETEDL